jgi:WD40 repeat protein
VRAEVGPPPEAILRISTTMHGAQIPQIATDSNDRYLVTASFDNTVRVWSLPQCTLLRVLRMPVAGERFSVFTASISPDGRTIAVGGFVNPTSDNASDSKSAYLFDRETGAFRKRLDGLQGAVTNLAYSKDGRYLAAMLNGAGIRVYDVDAGYAPLLSDSDYGGIATWANFDREGRLVTISTDSNIRLYSPGAFDRPSAKTRFGQELLFHSSAAFSPDGALLAVSGDRGADVYSARDLSLLYRVAGDEKNSFSSVAWSADGQSLFAGAYSKILRWAGRGRGPSVILSIPSDEQITALAALNDGSVLFATSEPAIGVVHQDSEVAILQGSETFDWEERPETLAIAPDGKTIEARSTRPQRLVRFSLQERGVFLDPPEDPSLDKALTNYPGVSIEDWRGTNHPSVNGQLVELDRGEISRSLAIDPHNQTIVLGTSWWLRAMDFHGKEIWKVPVPSSVESVNVSSDGRLVLSTHRDGTLRWRRRGDGREVLAVLVHNDGQRWVAWTPEGYYDASVGGEELIGWQVDRGSERTPDFFSAAAFREQFYRPDVIAQVLDASDFWEALKLADRASGRRTESAELKELLPPVIQIVSVAPGNVVERPDLNLTYHIRSPSTPIKGIKVFVDGRPVLYARSVCGNSRDCMGTVNINVPKKDIMVTMVGENASGVSSPAAINWNWSGPADIPKPNLYLLAVGVSKYANPFLELKYASSDAAAFAEAVRRQQGGLYERIVTRVILNEGATLSAIKEGLAWLKQNVSSPDVAMVFLSGQSAGRYTSNYDFLPYDADVAHSDLTSLHDFELEYFLSSISGKAFLFLDSCHSGGFYETKGSAKTNLPADVNHLANDLAQNGVVVFASSSSQQLSFENDVWGHGAFTKALLEGLSGGAASPGRNSVISINDLATYVSRRVEVLTDGKQSPSIAKPAAVPDSAIALVP